MSPRGPLGGPPVPTRRYRTDGLLFRDRSAAPETGARLANVGLAAACEQGQMRKKVPPLRASRPVTSRRVESHRLFVLRETDWMAQQWRRMVKKETREIRVIGKQKQGESCLSCTNCFIHV